MPRLSQHLHEALTPDVLTTLFKRSVFTCLAFVRTNPEVLTKITGLQYDQVLDVKDAILTKFSSKLRHGDKYYDEIVSHCAIVQSGIGNLDKLLDSGFMTGNIYELCGFAGCGKTQICMTVAANICISGTQQQVFYIDTKNDVSAQRLTEIMEKKKVEAVGETLQRIQICQVRTAEELLEGLHQLRGRLEASKEKFLGFRLVVIDSLSALFQQQQNQSEGLSLLNNVANMLKYVSVEYHLVVLLTNYVSSWTSEETEAGDEDQVVLQQVHQPALGKYWAHVPNVRVMVRKVEGANECFLVVLKSPDRPIGMSVKVKLGDDGVT